MRPEYDLSGRTRPSHYWKVGKMNRWREAVREILETHDDQTRKGDELVAALLDVRLEGSRLRPCWCGKSQYKGADHQHE
jgi:hypothetical protein